MIYCSMTPQPHFSGVRHYIHMSTCSVRPSLPTPTKTKLTQPIPTNQTKPNKIKLSQTKLNCCLAAKVTLRAMQAQTHSGRAVPPFPFLSGVYKT